MLYSIILFTPIIAESLREIIGDPKPYPAMVVDMNPETGMSHLFVFTPHGQEVTNVPTNTLANFPVLHTAADISVNECVNAAQPIETTDDRNESTDSPSDADVPPNPESQHSAPGTNAIRVRRNVRSR